MRQNSDLYLDREVTENEYHSLEKAIATKIVKYKENGESFKDIDVPNRQDTGSHKPLEPKNANL